MKKLLLGLGTLATIVAPIAAVVSCSTGTHHTEKKDDGVKAPAATDTTGGGSGSQTPVDLSGAKFEKINDDHGNDVSEEKLAFKKLGDDLKAAEKGDSKLLTGKVLQEGDIELDKNDFLARFTYKDIPVSNDEVEDATDDAYPVVRITVKVNGKLGIVKIELLSEDGHDVKDVTDANKDNFEADKVTAAINKINPDGGNAGNQGGKATTGDALAQMTTPIKAAIEGSTVDQAIKTAALDSLDAVKDADGFATYMTSPEYIAFTTAVNNQAKPDTDNAGNSGDKAGDNGPQTIDHDEAIKKATAMVEEMLTKTKYNMDNAEKTRLVNYLIDTAGDYELSIDGILPGQKTDEWHKGDDFLVLVKGAPEIDFTGEEDLKTGPKQEGVEKDKVNEVVGPDQIKELLVPGKTKTNLYYDAGAELDEQDKTLESEWAEPKNEVKESNFAIYLQSKDDGTTTFQVMKIAKFGDEYFELDSKPENSAVVDNKFTWRAFTATHAPVVAGTDNNNQGATTFKDTAKANLEDAVSSPSAEDLALDGVGVAFNEVNGAARAAAETAIDGVADKTAADKITSDFNKLVNAFPALLTKAQATEAKVADIKTMIEDILSQTKYKMEEDQINDLADYLFGTAEEGSTLTIGDILHGIVDGGNIKAGHGDDDFAVLIQSDKPLDVTHVDGYRIDSTLHYTGTDNVDHGLGEQIGDDQSPRQVQNAKWGYQNANNLGHSRFVIWLQTDESGSTLQVGEVYQFNGKTFEGDQPKDFLILQDSEI